MIKKNHYKIELFKYSLLLFAGLLPIVLTGCFEEDQRVPPYHFNGESYEITRSIYDYQLFFQLDGNRVVSDCSIDAWDLAFENGMDGWHIRINSGNYLGIAHTGTTLFDSVFTFNPKRNYLFDNPNGDPDSTAVGNWWAPELQTSKNQVYLLGKYDGAYYRPFKKLTFLSVSDTNYIFRCANIDGTFDSIFTIEKDKNTNYSYFSLKENGSQVAIEPEKDTWDLFFGQYYTTLIAPDGTPTPYPVRGTLLNPYKVEAALDTTMAFENITLNELPAYSFSSKWDFIGHDWKAVKVDEKANQATYTVREGYNYIIKSVNGDYYKFRFVSYNNDSGERGYPSIEFVKLN